MSGVSSDLKRKIAHLYTANENALNQLDPTALTAFALELLKLIRQEKVKAGSSHDLEVLEGSISHLKNDSEKLKASKPGSDDYDFAANDCRKVIDSTKKWLKMEGLI